jgi:hypothetical protein
MLQNRESGSNHICMSANRDEPDYPLLRSTCVRTARCFPQISDGLNRTYPLATTGIETVDKCAPPWSTLRRGERPQGTRAK